MTAIEAYRSIENDIANAVEVLACIPKTQPVSKGFHEGVSIVQLLSEFQTPIWLLTGTLFRLSNLIKDHCGVELPTGDTKESIVTFLNHFKENKDAIITGFQWMIDNPDKGHKWGYTAEEFTSYHSFLLNFVHLVSEKVNNIQEQFDKLILAIDSDQSLDLTELL